MKGIGYPVSPPSKVAPANFDNSFPERNDVMLGAAGLRWGDKLHGIEEPRIQQSKFKAGGVIGWLPIGETRRVVY